ncbi:hypothetical protein E2L08_15595 [Palleronia sediminis]|uniref:Sulfotransferase family protein n=1 Tax=Palleronia sediminis TaxID=2547833 RepID=A0A4R5ZXP1_9RHOB|nr:sulfotransferase family 2 domain-containing protein [Palleronia sediminis]TDL75024.1 hypothetical protein E2L08_15595 [Palleronia sediminis]
MGVHIDKFGLSYFSVPKVACSSLKHFLFQIENGFAFRNFWANGKYYTIHNVCYSSRPFEKEKALVGKDKFTFAVVRDPVSRFISAYRDKVAGRCIAPARDLTDRDRDNGMVPEPDLGTFVANLERYRDLSPEVRRHTEPMTFYLGTDPAFFDRIYGMRELDEVVEDVRQRVGGTVPALPHRNASTPPEGGAQDLSDRQDAAVRNYYAEDYRIFGAWV